jgi:AraC-like DNA-binding protein
MSKLRASRSQRQPDWVRLAELYDHHLTTDSPMWVNEGAEPTVTPLQVHVHRGMDVGILLRGGYELQYGDYSFRPQRGDVWLGAMWEPHAWRVLEPDTQSAQVCFLPEVLDERLENDVDLLRIFTVPASNRPRVTSEEMRQEVLGIAEMLRREVAGKRPGWRSVARAGLIQLLILLYREWQEPASTLRTPGTSANDLARIAPALALAHAAADARVPPRAAAAACSLSLSAFHRIFRRTMGLSYGRFCLRSRLAQAAEALLGTDLPVQAVAERAGFTDASHLHRAFVAEYACTPAEYRHRAWAASAPASKSR